MDLKKFFHSRRLTTAISIVAFIIGGFVGLGSLMAFGQREPSSPAGNNATQAPPTQVQLQGATETPSAHQSTSAAGPTGSSLAVAENLQNAFVGVARKVLPVVVEINVTDIIQQQTPQFSSPFNFFFGNQGQPQARPFTEQGLGSGVIVRQTGDTVYVLTNNHVVGKANNISVKLYDGRTFPAKLVGADSRRDLALVSFQTKGTVPVADLGDSNALQVGDWVLAFGNPLGYESTVTAGIVSALGRQAQGGSGIASYTSYIQTDAAINEGNSGGALVNIKGQVIGLNTWIASPSGGSVGLGFAIPINSAKVEINQFINKGKVEYGWLGVTTGDPSANTIEDLGLGKYTGGFVYGIITGSPAAKAGLLPGDYITSINNQDVKNSSDLTQIVGNAQPGDTLNLDVIRNDRSVHLKVTIATRPSETVVAKDSANVWPGIIVVDITASIRQQLNIPKNAGNVVIGSVESGGPASNAGLRTGDIVKKINNTNINSVKDFYTALNNSRSNSLMFTIYRGGSQFVIGISE